MINFPFLTLLLVLPLVGVGLILFIQGTQSQALRNIRSVALLTSSAALLVSWVIWSDFDPDKSSFQLIHKSHVFGGVGLEYVVGVDGISLLMVLLTTLLTQLVILAGWNRIRTYPKIYYICLLSMETFLIGAFISLNVLMFYVFFEAILIPMFLIIGIWGGENRIYATFKFFLYTFFGSILMLVAFLFIGSHLNGFNFMQWLHHTESVFMPPIVHYLWWALFIGFAIKIPMFPLHTWLPDAHVQAPATASMMLAGVLLKLGGYAMIRFHLQLFPTLSLSYFPIVAGLSVIAIIYASLVAWKQEDMKKLVAYSSIAHMGYVTLGIYTHSVIGLKGAVLQMLSHGLISAGLFYVVDILYRRTHTRDMDQYGGVVSVAPKISSVAFLLILGLISLPLTSGFVGELMVTFAVFKTSQFWGICTVIGVILAPVYGLTFYRKIFLGKPSERVLKMEDITFKEFMICATLIVLMVWVGVYPNTFTYVVDASVLKIMKGI